LRPYSTNFILRIEWGFGELDDAIIVHGYLAGNAERSVVPKNRHQAPVAVFLENATRGLPIGGEIRIAIEDEEFLVEIGERVLERAAGISRSFSTSR